MTSRQRWTLLATIIGSGAVFLDGTIVNVALRSIGRELPSSLFGVLGKKVRKFIRWRKAP